MINHVTSCIWWKYFQRLLTQSKETGISVEASFHSMKNYCENLEDNVL